jgi:hypothetical protein
MVVGQPDETHRLVIVGEWVLSGKADTRGRPAPRPPAWTPAGLNLDFLLCHAAPVLHENLMT